MWLLSYFRYFELSDIVSPTLRVVKNTRLRGNKDEKTTKKCRRRRARTASTFCKLWTKNESSAAANIIEFLTNILFNYYFSFLLGKSLFNSSVNKDNEVLAPLSKLKNKIFFNCTRWHVLSSEFLMASISMSCNDVMGSHSRISQISL